MKHVKGDSNSLSNSYSCQYLNYRFSRLPLTSGGLAFGRGFTKGATGGELPN